MVGRSFFIPSEVVVVVVVIVVVVVVAVVENTSIQQQKWYSMAPKSIPVKYKLQTQQQLIVVTYVCFLGALAMNACIVLHCIAFLISTQAARSS